MQWAIINRPALASPTHPGFAKSSSLSATKIAEPCLWHPDCATAFGFSSPEQQGPTPGDVTWNGGPSVLQGGFRRQQSDPLVLCHVVFHGGGV